jgi:hypothetical protein
MTLNDAYIKGLDDAEAITIKILTQLVNNEPLDKYNNPKLETLKKALKIQLDYVNGLANSKRSNLAKYARIELEKGKQLVANQN